MLRKTLTFEFKITDSLRGAYNVNPGSDQKGTIILGIKFKKSFSKTILIHV